MENLSGKKGDILAAIFLRLEPLDGKIKSHLGKNPIERFLSFFFSKFNTLTCYNTKYIKRQENRE